MCDIEQNPFIFSALDQNQIIFYWANLLNCRKYFQFCKIILTHKNANKQCLEKIKIALKIFKDIWNIAQRIAQHLQKRIYKNAFTKTPQKCRHRSRSLHPNQRCEKPAKVGCFIQNNLSKIYRSMLLLTHQRY